MAEQSNCDPMLVDKIIRHSHKIKKLRVTDRDRYFEEIIFMGQLWGETASTIANRYFGRSFNIVRDDKTGNLKANYVTNEWLDIIDKEAIIVKDENTKIQLFDLLCYMKAVV